MAALHSSPSSCPQRWRHAGCCGPARGPPGSVAIGPAWRASGALCRLWRAAAARRSNRVRGVAPGLELEQEVQGVGSGGSAGSSPGRVAGSVAPNYARWRRTATSASRGRSRTSQTAIQLATDFGWRAGTSPRSRRGDRPGLLRPGSRTVLSAARRRSPRPDGGQASRGLRRHHRRRPGEQLEPPHAPASCGPRRLGLKIRRTTYRRPARRPDERDALACDKNDGSSTASSKIRAPATSTEHHALPPERTSPAASATASCRRSRHRGRFEPGDARADLPGTPLERGALRQCSSVRPRAASASRAAARTPFYADGTSPAWAGTRRRSTSRSTCAPTTHGGPDVRPGARGRSRSAAGGSAAGS